MNEKKGAKPSNGANKPLNKSATYAELANTTGLTRKQVVAFFDALEAPVPPPGECCPRPATLHEARTRQQA